MDKPWKRAMELGFGRAWDSIKDANIVIFLTNHPKLTGIQAEDVLGNSARPLLVIDCWHNISNPDKIAGSDVKIFRIGDGTV